MRQAWLPWAIAAALCGCTNLDQPFFCQVSSQCLLESQQGVCEPSGFCSFRDTTCASGSRYAQLAGNGLGRQCTGIMNPDSGTDGPDAEAADGPVDGPADAPDGPLMPTVLAMDQPLPVGIAVRDGNVYWTNYVTGGSLMKKCTDCATPAAPLAAGQPHPIWIAIDAAGANLYWANDGSGIGRCSLPDCAGGSSVIVLEPNGIFGLSIEGANLYWINRTEVRSCSVSDCSTSALSIASNPTFVEMSTNIVRGAGNLVATADGVFWARNLDPSGGGAIMKCPLSNCNNMPTVFAGNQNYPWGLAADGTDLYWTNRHTSAGSIGHCSPLSTSSNCSPVSTLAQSQIAPVEVTVDATRVYWTNNLAGTVLSCARAGCSGGPTILASGQNRPYGIAVDANYVFWTNQGSTGVSNGQVMRIAK